MGRKRKKKNPYLGDDPLPDDLVTREEIEFREELLGEFDAGVFGRPDMEDDKEPEKPKDVGPLDDMGLSASDRKMIPPEMLVSMDVEDNEGQHFTLFVSEVTTAVQKRGNLRLPVLRFKVQLALVKYYMIEGSTGSKRPAIDHAPISGPFDLEIPFNFLPSAVRKYPDMVSPALATKILNKMMDKYPWSTVKPAPKSDIERLLPDTILQKIKGGAAKGL